MSEGPVDDSWIAAIHRSAIDFTPVGSGVVIDDRRVLTCAHVVPQDGADVWVAFPKAGDPTDRRRVVSVTMPEVWQVADVAVLELESEVPAIVAAAPLRCPRPADLATVAWWAYGFPRGDPLGNAAHGRIGAALGYGWVRLDAESRYLVEPGFSGAGLWSPEYRAVIALVGQANERGDGRALTVQQADLYVPEQGLGALTRWSAEAAGDVALAAWGWTLSADVEAKRHWLPRSRGVMVDSERGHRFRGRTTALTELVGWLDRDVPDRRVLVVTGAPGAGKSAVLGRVVATADAALRKLYPHGDDAVRATTGAVACAVHAKDKTALEVATEIARAASAALPQQVEDLPVAIQEALADQRGRRFNVIIDALDEAADPAEARMIINAVVLPLAETCAAAGVQVVVGTRRRDNGGDLLAAFGGAATTIDLDEARYFAQEDLTAYALETLRLSGEERLGNPYADEAVAGPVARRISALADGNFLVAGLVARTHGLHDERPVAVAELKFTPTVHAAVQAYVRRLETGSRLSATAAFTALAFAEAPGMPIDVWQTAIEALDGERPTSTALMRFARSAAASFLIEAGTGFPVFRLFHQSLNDALLAARAQFATPAQDHRALASALLAMGRHRGWPHAPDYLLRSLAVHATRGEMTDDLLADDDYPLHADLRRILRHIDHATTAAGRTRRRVLRLTPEAFDAEPAERAAMFGMTEILEGLGHTYANTARQAPYCALWSRVRAHAERTIFRAHAGWVRGVCAFTSGEEMLIATAGDDGEVAVWDPVTGDPRWGGAFHDWALVGPGWQRIVEGVCAFPLGDDIYLASVGYDATLRIWDARTGAGVAILRGHEGPVHAVCAFTAGEDTFLASAGDDATVRIWCLAEEGFDYVLSGFEGPVEAICSFTLGEETYLAGAGAEVWIWAFTSQQTHQLVTTQEGSSHAICSFTLGGETYLASAGDDAAVRIWNLASDLESHEVVAVTDGPVRALDAFITDERTYLAVAGEGGEALSRMTIWDPAAHEIRGSFEQPYVATAFQALTLGRRTVFATGGSEGVVRIWDPHGDAMRPSVPELEAEIHGVCTIPSAERVLFATASNDGVVRIWDAATGELQRTLSERTGRTSWRNDMCALRLGGRVLLVTSDHEETVWISDPSTGELEYTFTVPGGAGRACPITFGGDSLLVTSGDDGTLRIWDPVTGELRQAGNVCSDSLGQPCVVVVGGRTLIAATDLENVVRVWDPATDQVTQFPTGHPNIVTMCAAAHGDDTFIATGGWDAEVRIWEPLTGELRHTLSGHTGFVFALCVPILGTRPLLATASQDHTVRIWDPDVGTCLLVIPVHHLAQEIAADGARILIGLGKGMVCLELDPDLLTR